MTELEEKAKWVRQQALEMSLRVGGGHIAPSFSCVEILVALYQGGILKVKPQDPKWPERDRFILSKGHASLSFYPVLADMGYFPLSWLDTFNHKEGKLGGMADGNVPGVELSSGSLGHGLSVGAGMAFAAKLNGEDYKTFVLLGDGECQEGSIWEAALFAAHHKLANLMAIIDRNGLQALAPTEEVMKLEPLANRWVSFGWEVLEADGHDIEDIRAKLHGNKGRPTVLICKTIKGKGISFAQNKPIWHYRIPMGDDEISAARRELA